jgi:hypothetical protein
MTVDDWLTVIWEAAGACMCIILIAYIFCVLMKDKK